ncbi:MAG: M15 family metallopeptidase, partial [Ignavibacteriota bacterium]
KDNSIDTGTGFDCFSELSHTENPIFNPQQRANRLLLKSLMDKYGFKSLAEEWWHFTLRNEPFPKTYFDFEIK